MQNLTCKIKSIKTTVDYWIILIGILSVLNISKFNITIVNNVTILSLPKNISHIYMNYFLKSHIHNTSFVSNVEVVLKNQLFIFHPFYFEKYFGIQFSCLMWSKSWRLPWTSTLTLVSAHFPFDLSSFGISTYQTNLAYYLFSLVFHFFHSSF